MAELTGTVSDSSGAVVVVATITITNLATNAERSLQTNSSGVYDAPSLPPGQYTVKVSMSGFRAVASNVELQVAAVARQNFKLEVGNVNETGQVAAPSPKPGPESTSAAPGVRNQAIR